MTKEPVRWELTRRALSSFLSRLEGTDEVTLIVFNDRSERLGGWTRHTFDVFSALGRVETGGGTALFRALLNAVPVFKEAITCPPCTSAYLGRQRSRVQQQRFHARAREQRPGGGRDSAFWCRRLCDRHRHRTGAREPANPRTFFRHRRADTSKSCPTARRSRVPSAASPTTSAISTSSRSSQRRPTARSTGSRSTHAMPATAYARGTDMWRTLATANEGGSCRQWKYAWKPSRLKA